VSGLVGSLASLYWNVDVVSAGASGAIFGVFGGILGFSIRQRNVLPRPLLQPLWSQSVTFVIVNAVLGMSIPGIDLAAHLGGLVAGVLCSFAISQPLDAPAGSLSLRALLVTGLSAVIVYAGVRLVEYAHRDSQSRLAIVDKLEAASARLQQSALAYQAKRLSSDEFVDILEQEVLPAYRQAIRTLPDPENVDPKQRARLVDLRMKILASISLVTELNEALHSQDDEAIATAVRGVLGDDNQ
jgi:rhomboid protease GluP